MLYNETDFVKPFNYSDSKSIYVGIRVPAELVPFLDRLCELNSTTRGKYVLSLVLDAIHNFRLEEEIRTNYAGKDSFSVDDMREVFSRIIKDAKF